MRVLMRKTTYDSETGSLVPGMTVEVSKVTGERWIKYRIADEVAAEVKPEEPKPAKPKQVNAGSVEILEEPVDESGSFNLELMSKSEIRTLAEKNGIHNLPVKASKVEMIKRLSGVELK